MWFRTIYIVSRTYFAIARSSLYIESKSLKVSFSSAFKVRREVLDGLTSCGFGFAGRFGTIGLVLRSRSIYFQVSPLSAIVFTTNSQGSQWEGWSRITAFVVVEAMISGIQSNNEGFEVLRQYS